MKYVTFHEQIPHKITSLKCNLEARSLSEINVRRFFFQEEFSDLKTRKLRTKSFKKMQLPPKKYSALF